MMSLFFIVSVRKPSDGPIQRRDMLASVAAVCHEIGPQNRSLQDGSPRHQHGAATGLGGM